VSSATDPALTLSRSRARMDADPTKWKWEKRRRIGYAPSARSGCSMTLWAAKDMGVSFGGVYDEEKDEESLESVFYQDMSVSSRGRATE
jgi:hypothetical protein